MRTFIGIDIPDEIRDRLYEFQNKLNKLDLDASYTFKKQFHITLIFLGELRKEDIESIKEKLSRINLDKISIKISGIGYFTSRSNPEIVWVGIESENLNNLVNNICKCLDFKLDRAFNPHITLCRIKSRKNMESLVKIISMNKGLVFGEFKADNFLLKQSIPDKGRHIHKILASFELK